VCGLERDVFDRNSVVGYDTHIKHEHNMWHYIYFIIYLRRKLRTEYTGSHIG